MEHIGAIEHNIKPDKEFILYNARLKYNKEILDILNGYFDKIGWILWHNFFYKYLYFLL